VNWDDEGPPRAQRGKPRRYGPSLNDVPQAMPRPPVGLTEEQARANVAAFDASPAGDVLATLDAQLESGRKNHHGTLNERSKLTAERVRRVMNSIRELAPPELALRGAGITKELFAKYTRLADDDEAHPIYRIFIEDFGSVTEEVCRKIIHNANDVAAVSNDVRWHMYLLERFDPAFRTKVTVEVEHQVTVQLQALIVALEGELPPEMFERVLEVAASIKPGETASSLAAQGRRR
jgi:hypothetical protein